MTTESPSYFPRPCCQARRVLFCHDQWEECTRPSLSVVTTLRVFDIHDLWYDVAIIDRKNIIDQRHLKSSREIE